MKKAKEIIYRVHTHLSTGFKTIRDRLHSGFAFVSRALKECKSGAEMAMAQDKPEDALGSLDRAGLNAWWRSPFYWRTRASAEEALGRFSKKMKNRAAAREHYQKFLDGMKLADPGLPEVEDARKRLAGMK
jgi:hypothetical protein